MPTYSNYRNDLRQLIAATLAAADPYAAVQRHITRAGNHIEIGGRPVQAARIFLVAVGKAALPMAAAATAALGDRIQGGIAIAKRDGAGAAISLAPPLRTFFAAHPVSDEAGVAATTAVLEMVAEAAAEDVVLCLISGGASALLCQPLIPLVEWQALTESLLASGCTIQEFNTVRKQLDKVKGGGLAAAAAPARCITLILSDVVGNPVDIIGSGPTVTDSHTAADAAAILQRYGVENAAAKAALRAREGEQSMVLPTMPLIVGDVRTAAEAACKRAAALGFSPLLLTSHLEGEAREVGRFAAALAKDMPAQSCWLLGGETTVTMRGTGFGGRNQEVALAAAIAAEGVSNIAIASFATDGDDGPTQAAGAVVTGETAAVARAAGLSPTADLAQNDSGTFFRTLDQQRTGHPPTLITTGLTGTNVNDLVFILKY